MQKIELKVGLFVTITLLLIMASIGYVAYKKDMFSKVYTYTLSSKTGENLTEGMPVVFWGFNIGRVSSLELIDQGVLIQIKIPERHNRVIRSNSKFVLDKPLFGASRIVVETDNLNAPPLSPKTVSEISVSNDINEMIKRALPIVDKADRIMANVEQVTEKLADPGGDVNRILKNTETVTANLADPKGDVNRILKNAEALTARFAKKESVLEMAVGNTESVKSVHEALANVRDITVRIDKILAKADSITGKTGEEIYGPDGVLPLVRDILRDLVAKLTKIDTTLDNINKVSAEAVDSTKDLKVLRSELDAAITAIGNLAEELNRKIPFKAKPEIKLP
ncbi:MAG: MCE family protein [Proteobacteria bacterium]|nr:MCE family protein [Pseudomonadota bacterium]MBU2226688.1 MCE family protein [Pseudomonadota bacterium]MBU2261910.1 MCE family protein [Pseudomonadota bacterium]